MKNLVLTLCMVAMFGFSQTAVACGSATITPSGPTSCVSTDTYTGTHSFSSSGCTFYEWTVSNGTITGPGGITVTNGTLCVTENASCFSELASGCTVAAISSLVASGNGAPVTVNWGAGPNTSLSLKVREVGTITLSASDDVTISNPLPTPTSVVRSNIGSSSSTFTASIPGTLCPGTTVRWTLNGNFVGTGNPRTISAGQCGPSATVCATTNFNGSTSGQRCTFVTGDPQPGSITGSDEIPINQFRPYVFTGASNVNSVSWFPKTNGGQVIGSGANANCIIFDPNVTFVEFCVAGTWACGNYEVCKRVFRAQNPAQTPSEEDARPTFSEDQGESNQRNSNLTSSSISVQSLSVFPSPVEAGNELTIQLPDYGQVVDVMITDLQGRRVYQARTDQQQLLLGTADFPKGLYVLSVNSKEGIDSKKFIVK